MNRQRPATKTDGMTRNAESGLIRRMPGMRCPKRQLPLGGGLQRPEPSVIWKPQRSGAFASHHVRRYYYYLWKYSDADCHWSFIQSRPEPFSHLPCLPTLDCPRLEFSGFVTTAYVHYMFSQSVSGKRVGAFAT